MHTSYPSDHRMIGVGTGAAGLDLFEAIAGVRDTAIKYKSLTLIGLLALTVAVSAEMEYGIMGGPAEWCTEEIIVEQMAKEFDVGEEELRLAMKDAEPMAPWWIAELIAKEEEESGEFFLRRREEGELIFCDRAGAEGCWSELECVLFASAAAKDH